MCVPWLCMWVTKSVHESRTHFMSHCISNFCWSVWHDSVPESRTLYMTHKLYMWVIIWVKSVDVCAVTLYIWVMSRVNISHELCIWLTNSFYGSSCEWLLLICVPWLCTYESCHMSHVNIRHELQRAHTIQRHDVHELCMRVIIWVTSVDVCAVTLYIWAMSHVNISHELCI